MNGGCRGLSLQEVQQGQAQGVLPQKPPLPPSEQGMPGVGQEPTTKTTTRTYTGNDIQRYLAQLPPDERRKLQAQLKPGDTIEVTSTETTVNPSYRPPTQSGGYVPIAVKEPELIPAQKETRQVIPNQTGGYVPVGPEKRETVTPHELYERKVEQARATPSGHLVSSRTPQMVSQEPRPIIKNKSITDQIGDFFSRENYRKTFGLTDNQMPYTILPEQQTEPGVGPSDIKQFLLETPSYVYMGGALSEVGLALKGSKIATGLYVGASVVAGGIAGGYTAADIAKTTQYGQLTRFKLFSAGSSIALMTMGGSARTLASRFKKYELPSNIDYSGFNRKPTVKAIITEKQPVRTRPLPDITTGKIIEYGKNTELPGSRQSVERVQTGYRGYEGVKEIAKSPMIDIGKGGNEILPPTESGYKKGLQYVITEYKKPSKFQGFKRLESGSLISDVEASQPILPLRETQPRVLISSRTSPGKELYWRGELIKSMNEKTGLGFSIPIVSSGLLSNTKQRSSSILNMRLGLITDILETQKTDVLLLSSHKTDILKGTKTSSVNIDDVFRIPARASEQRKGQLLEEETQQKQEVFLPRTYDTNKPDVTTPNPPIVFLPPPDDDTEYINKKRTTKKQHTAFIPVVHEKGRWIRLTSKPLSYRDAENLLGKALDETKAAVGKIKPTKGIPEPLQQYVEPFQTRAHKFKRKGNLLIEKREYRMDKSGEIQHISTKGWKANTLKGMISQKHKNISSYVGKQPTSIKRTNKKRRMRYV